MHGTGIRDVAGDHWEDTNLSDQTQNWRARTLVTGAAGGLGREVAIQLAARGCAVAIADINAAGTTETAQLARSHGAEIEEIVTDLTVEGAPEAAVAKVVARWGGIDVL